MTWAAVCVEDTMEDKVVPDTTLSVSDRSLADDEAAGS